ncbi:MBOAT, membrane-bound O-acyltransferase family-domain-containing protein [Entophlyctis helioformis]|nr:MBOAT, membrane-bound O-acyltransferase family-domain-containing protein [Entophlyctis helioformis]
MAVSNDQVGVVALLLLPYAAAAAWHRLPPSTTTTQRHLFSVAFTSLSWSLFFGWHGIAELLSSCLVLFAVMRLVGRRPYGPLLVTFMAMAHLSFNRLVKQLASFGDQSFDISAPQMVLVIKISAMQARELVVASDPIILASAVQEMPTLIEFLGYLFSFTGFVVGPAFSFADYRNFVGNKPPFDKTPDPWQPALERMALGIACLLAFVAMGRYSYHWAATPEFVAFPLYARLAYLQLAGLSVRFKFYGVWKLAEGACAAAGFGYSGRDPHTHRDNWDRHSNVNILQLESAQSLKVILDNWNINTAKWLRHSVYLRLYTYSSSAFVPFVVTFIVSAIWHGWYPGYYLTFITGALFTYTGRQVRRAVRPWVLLDTTGQRKIVYDWLTWATSLFAVNYLVAPFIVLSAQDGLQIWSATWYAGHVGMVVLLAVARFWAVAFKHLNSKNRKTE